MRGLCVNIRKNASESGTSAVYARGAVGGAGELQRTVYARNAVGTGAAGVEGAPSMRLYALSMRRPCLEVPAAKLCSPSALCACMRGLCAKRVRRLCPRIRHQTALITLKLSKVEKRNSHIHIYLYT